MCQQLHGEEDRLKEFLGMAQQVLGTQHQLEDLPDEASGRRDFHGLTERGLISRQTWAGLRPFHAVDAYHYDVPQKDA